MQKVILASQSKQRKMMMELLNIPFVTIPADIDEKAIRSDDLKIQAESIAKAKADKILSLHEGIVIAGDLFCAVDGRLLEKPRDKEEAKEMLRFQSGKMQEIYCGFVYIDQENGIEHAGCIVSEVKLRNLDEEEIELYVKNSPVLTWAAAWAPLGYGSTFVQELRGSFSGIHGLPLELLIPLLRKSGIDPRPNT